MNFQSLLLFTCALFQCTMSDHRHEIQLDSKFAFGWTVDQSAGIVVLDATVETNGYVGIGLSLRGKMDKAEMSVGGVYDDGSSYFGVYQGRHHKLSNDKDFKKHWNFMEAHENSTHTFVKYSRPLVISDHSSIPIKDQEIYIIWAIGKSDKLKKHKGHGKTKVNLINPSDSDAYLPHFHIKLRSLKELQSFLDSRSLHRPN